MQPVEVTCLLTTDSSDLPAADANLTAIEGSSVAPTEDTSIPPTESIMLQSEEDLYDRVDKNVTGSGYVCRVCGKIFKTPGKMKGIYQCLAQI